MQHRTALSLVLLAGLALVVVVAADQVWAQGPKETPPKTVTGTLGNGFSYQGQLKQGSSLVSGTCSIGFGLWDAATLGTQVGVTLTQSIAVANGLFTSQPLDFGSTAFDGNARYLQIATRCGSESAYTALAPRQTLTAAPYALFAKRFAGYQNIKVVAKSGGDYASIAGAVNNILDAGPTNHYLVYVAPGVYTETVTMKPYVDIQGAGPLVTRITYGGSADLSTGTVVGADHAALRSLTVESTGGYTDSVAIFNSVTSPSLSDIAASAFGSINNYGVYNNYSSAVMMDVTALGSGGTHSYGIANTVSSPTMTNVTATASSGFYSTGLSNISSSPAMLNVIASASGGSIHYGIYDESSSPTMTNVTASATGGNSAYGAANVLTSAPTMLHVTLTASGAFSSYGLYTDGASAAISNSIISASGTTSYGIYNTAPPGTYTVTVNSSQVIGTNYTIYNHANVATRVGGSQLSGGIIYNPPGGSITCINVWDENYLSAGYNACP